MSFGRRRRRSTRGIGVRESALEALKKFLKSAYMHSLMYTNKKAAMITIFITA